MLVAVTKINIACIHMELNKPCMHNIIVLAAADMQVLPYGCQVEIDVKKRDGSDADDFIVCVRGGTYA